MMVAHEGGIEMDIKKYLSRYHYMELDIKHMQNEIAEYRRLANSIPGMNFDAIRVDRTRSLDAPFVKWIHKALDKELQVDELKKELQTVKCEIISVIDELEDTQCKMVLLHRYIDWLSWNEIAKIMFYSSASIRRLHDKAILNIKVPSNGKVEQV